MNNNLNKSEADIKKTEDEKLRKRNYRIRLKESKDTGETLKRLKTTTDEQGIKVTTYVTGTLQKHKINYESFISLLTLHEDDKISTIKVYIDRIDRLFRNLFKVHLTPDNLNLLNRTNEITTFLEENYKQNNTDKDRGTLETLRSYINAILTITDRLGELQIKNSYLEISTRLNRLYQEKTDSNERSHHERNNWISWKVLTKMVEKTLKTDLLTPQERVIAILYTFLISPRRIMDYQNMKMKKYMNNHKVPKYILKECESDPSFNYMIVNKAGNIRDIIFNQYKTRDSYGVIRVGVELDLENKQNFQLDNYVIKMLKPFLLTKNTGDYLLINPNTKQPYTQDKLSLYVGQVFKKITNKELNCNMLRKIFITDQIINNPTLSIAIKKRMSVFMGHSIGTQATYNRVLDPLKLEDFNKIREYGNE